jgi:hypothetical protein
MGWWERQVAEGTPETIEITFDGTEEAYMAITYGERWNGWECPFFTKENAEKVLRDLETEGFWSYDKESDTFYMHFDDYDEPDEFEGIDINGTKYYPIGNGCWCWSRC